MKGLFLPQRVETKLAQQAMLHLIDCQCMAQLAGWLSRLVSLFPADRFRDT